MEKKVLIITYYWPPSGGSGVQRWLKFTKYLPSLGWKPYIFTPANPSFAIRDESLLRDVPEEAEIIHFPIWEPYEAFFKLSGLFGGSRKSAKPTDLVSVKKKSIFQQVSTWVRGNFFIPDPRVFWVKPSVKFLLKYLNDHGIKTIITTGPPHSVHLIGLNLKRKKTSLKWIADFRDPWSEWGFLDSLRVGSIARSIHRKLEAQVTKTADEVITITPFYVRKFEKLSGRPVKLLTNGYDEEDFKNLAIMKHEKFILRHAGIVNEKCDPRPFMLAVKNLLLQQTALRSELVIDFVGEVHPDFKAFVQNDDVLKKITTFTPTIPHKQLMKFYGESAILLLVLTGYKDAEGYMPGKLFEYLATGLPVLGIGPEQGDAAMLLNHTGAGVMIDGSHEAAIQAFILEKLEAWKRPGNTIQPSGYQVYSRGAITRTLVEML